MITLTNLLLEEIAKRRLPLGTSLYSVEGRHLFEIRNSSGMTGHYIFYLVRIVNGEYFRMAEEIKDLDTFNKRVKDLAEMLESKIETTLTKFEEFLADPIKIEEAREQKRKEDAEHEKWLNKLQAGEL